MTDSARSIENLLYDYAERVDAGDFDGLGELFTHGRILGQVDGPPETVFEGRDRVRELYSGATRIYEDTGTPKTKHLTMNARIEVDEEAGTAIARANFLVTQATDTLPLQIIITGRYHDTFQRIDGRWWFDSRAMFADQAGDLSQHLTPAAISMNGSST